MHRKNTHPDAELIFVKDFADVSRDMEYDAIFYLHENLMITIFEKFVGKPVFINSVIETLDKKNCR